PCGVALKPIGGEAIGWNWFDVSDDESREIRFQNIEARHGIVCNLRRSPLARARSVIDAAEEKRFVHRNILQFASVLLSFVGRVLSARAAEAFSGAASRRNERAEFDGKTDVVLVQKRKNRLKLLIREVDEGPAIHFENRDVTLRLSPRRVCGE